MMEAAIVAETHEIISLRIGVFVKELRYINVTLR
jgi:hypothetical protein